MVDTKVWTEGAPPTFVTVVRSWPLFCVHALLECKKTNTHATRVAKSFCTIKLLLVSF